MKKRVEVIKGVEYTYRIYKDGSEAVLFQRKIAPTRTERAATPSARALSPLELLIEAPYPRVSADVMFERAWTLHHS